MSLGPWQLIIIALVILVLFGRGKISEMMGDFGKGIKSFKEGMSEEERDAARQSPRIEGPARDGAPRQDAKPMHEAKPAGETLDKSQIHTPSDSQ